MKTIYIPKGETVTYESLVTEHLIVDGCLKVAYGVKAKRISGSGVICAGTLGADIVRIDDVEADAIMCKRLIAKRVETPELFASESAAVADFLSAAYVETGKLTVTISEIDQVKAGEVINLTPKKRSLFGTLLSSALCSFWMRLTVPARPVLDAEYQQIAEEKPQMEPVETMEEPTAAAENEPLAELHPVVSEEKQPVDEELNRFVAMFKLMRDSGYTLKIVPGTPEENAPVFDFEHGTILRPAA